MSEEKRREYMVYRGPYEIRFLSAAPDQMGFLSLEAGFFVVCHIYYKDGTEECIVTDRLPLTPEGERKANEVEQKMTRQWTKH